MYAHTESMAGAMANAGPALLALPLADLPAIASVRIHTDADAARIEMQLSCGGVDQEQVAGLLAWADVLPDRSAAGGEFDDYIRLDVTGIVNGARVTVWTHLRGEYLVDTGCFLSLPLDGESHTVPLGVLRALAQHRAAVTSDA